MSEPHAPLHVALAENASLQQLPFADAFDALYEGVALATGSILSSINSLSAPKPGHWIVFVSGVGLLIYGWRERARNDASGAA